jgi:nicotinate-nucleotide pyrophosphorylase (carboxylating)
VEVEVSTPEDALAAACMGVDAVMLDNFSPAEARETYKRVKDGHPGIIVEVSGGVTPENAAEFARGADVISMGWLTHSAPGADLSMDIQRVP